MSVWVSRGLFSDSLQNVWWVFEWVGGRLVIFYEVSHECLSESPVDSWFPSKCRMSVGVTRWLFGDSLRNVGWVLDWLVGCLLILLEMSDGSWSDSGVDSWFSPECWIGVPLTPGLVYEFGSGKSKVVWSTSVVHSFLPKVVYIIINALSLLVIQQRGWKTIISSARICVYIKDWRSCSCVEMPNQCFAHQSRH